MSTNRGPIFIGGPDRCGKTTLQAFLSSHPNIAIPAVGSNFWTYFYGQFGDLRRAENFEACLNAMLHYSHAVYLQPDSLRIREEFLQGERTYARLFALFHEHYAERQGKPRWGDQTGLVERYADQIFAAYPDARMVHMIRDPRDRYEASLAMWPNGKARVGGATARWLYSVSWGKRNLKRYPDRYKIIRYETLVYKTEQTLREILSFLGEDYRPEILRMDGSPGHRDKLRQDATPASTSVLSADFIGRYRGRISKAEIAYLQLFAGRQMSQFGYSLDKMEFSAGDLAHFSCVDLPLNLLRMETWLAQELVQQHFPDRWGRKPSAHMIIKTEGQQKSQADTT